jgi:hypothetical protein
VYADYGWLRGNPANAGLGYVVEKFVGVDVGLRDDHSLRCLTIIAGQNSKNGGSDNQDVYKE